MLEQAISEAQRKYPFPAHDDYAAQINAWAYAREEQARYIIRELRHAVKMDDTILGELNEG